MRTFKDFKSFNQYLGLPAPLDNDIDIGYYDVPKMRLQSEPVSVDETLTAEGAHALRLSVMLLAPNGLAAADATLAWP